MKPLILMSFLFRALALAALVSSAKGEASGSSGNNFKGAFASFGVEEGDTSPEADAWISSSSFQRHERLDFLVPASEVPSSSTHPLGPIIQGQGTWRGGGGRSRGSLASLEGSSARQAAEEGEAAPKEMTVSALTLPPESAEHYSHRAMGPGLGARALLTQQQSSCASGYQGCQQV